MMSRDIGQQPERIPPLERPGLIGRVLEHWRRAQLVRSQKKASERRRTPERRFLRLMETAEAIASINPHGLVDLVCAILRPLQSDYLLALAEYGTLDMNSISSFSFFGPAVDRRLFTPDGMKF